MTDTIDNAVLCREVLGWTQVAPVNEVLAWETKAGLIESTPDFEHDIAAAMELAEAFVKKVEVDFSLMNSLVVGDTRWSVVIEYDKPSESLTMTGDTPAQAITRAVWALVNDKVVDNA